MTIDKNNNIESILKEIAKEVDSKNNVELDDIIAVMLNQTQSNQEGDLTDKERQEIILKILSEREF